MVSWCPGEVCNFVFLLPESNFSAAGIEFSAARIKFSAAGIKFFCCRNRIFCCRNRISAVGIVFLLPESNFLLPESNSCCRNQIPAAGILNWFHPSSRANFQKSQRILMEDRKNLRSPNTLAVTVVSI